MSPFLKTICVVLFAVFAGVFLPGSLLSNSLYSWTDTDGIKHFSNIAPPQKGIVELIKEEKFTLPQGHQFKVVKVFDGDTVRVEGFGLQFKIRLVGIDTPELGKKGQHYQPYSRRAKKELIRLIHKKTISLKQYGTGGYNRVLAEIFMGATNVNLEMIRSGLAEVYRGKLPKGLNANQYFQAEKKAKNSLKGMWAQETAYISPRLWRRQYPLK